MHSGIQILTAIIRDLTLPIFLDNLESKNAPSAPNNWINKIASISPVDACDSYLPEKISCLAYNTAINITVCTPVLKKKNATKYFFNRGIVENSTNTRFNSEKPFVRT